MKPSGIHSNNRLHRPVLEVLTLVKRCAILKLQRLLTIPLAASSKRAQIVPMKFLAR
ncbi:MAG TPA: hypothetical protein VH540_09975 [Ktedonobacterales bacterium]